MGPATESFLDYTRDLEWPPEGSDRAAAKGNSALEPENVAEEAT